jgi:chromosome segregation ATPase
MSPQVPGQLPSQPPQITPQNGSVPSATTTPPNSTGTPNTPPVIKTKAPKSEFQRLTNEWNETHEKLSANFRELTVIFADIKFLLQQLESQLKAAGITSDLSHCVEAADSCVKSFSDANANAASLDMHINQLDKNAFENASQEIKENFKKLTDRVAEAGNLGKATGILGAAQNASSTQSAPPAASTGAVTQPVPPAAPTGAVTQPTPPAALTGAVASSTPPAAPTGAVTQPTPPVKSFNATMQSGLDLLNQIDGKLEEIEASQNSLTKRIGKFETESLKLEQESSRLNAELGKVYKAWGDVKKLFDEQKARKELAIRSGIPFTPVEQAEYDLKRKNIQSLSSVSLQRIKDINKNLEKINRKYQNLSDKLDEVKNKKDEINSLFESASKMKADASKHLADSRLKINESILVRANRKHRADEFFEEIQKRDDELELLDAAFKIFKDNLKNMNNRFPKINNDISNLKLVTERMKNEIYPFGDPFSY